MDQRPFFIKRLVSFPLSLVLECTLLVIAFAAAPAYPSEDVPDRGGVTLFPPGDLYPHYIADPHRVGFGVQWLSFTDARIPGSGVNRVALRAGGRFGIARLHPSEEAERGWQVSLEGGFNAQFDADHSLDNIGWDGRYGLVITTAQSRQWAFKAGVLHDSSHVGDEYMERTGRRRIGYTRHELAAGASWLPTERFRTYGEAAWGYELSNKQLQEPGRVQFGLEYGSPGTLGKGRTGWYGAADLSAMEERDWRVDRCLQVGLAAHAGSRTWRFGVEWYRGRPPMGEFFQYTEEYVSLGLWVDI
jgi:hypothetical protein